MADTDEDFDPDFEEAEEEIDDMSELDEMDDMDKEDELSGVKKKIAAPLPAKRKVKPGGPLGIGDEEDDGTGKPAEPDLLTQVKEQFGDLNKISAGFNNQCKRLNLGKKAFVDKNSDSVAPLYNFLEDIASVKAVVKVYQGVILQVSTMAKKMSGAMVPLDPALARVAVAASVYGVLETLESSSNDYECVFTRTEENTLKMSYKVYHDGKMTLDTYVTIFDPELCI